MSFWLERLSILLQIYTFACNFCSQKGGRASIGYRASIGTYTVVVKLWWEEGPDGRVLMGGSGWEGPDGRVLMGGSWCPDGRVLMSWWGSDGRVSMSWWEGPDELKQRSLFKVSRLMCVLYGSLMSADHEAETCGLLSIFDICLGRISIPEVWELIIVDIRWYLLIFVDICWYLLIFIIFDICLVLWALSFWGVSLSIEFPYFQWWDH